MSRILSRSAVGSLALAAVFALATPAAAQFRVNPAVLNNQPALVTGGFAAPVGVAAPGFAPVYNPFWGGGWYGPMDPTYGALTGLANVTTANAQAQVTLQQSRLLNEQAKQAQIDTRRDLINQVRWEYDTTPSLETQRERDRAMAVRRSLNDPPLSEITSGSALNTLMEQVRRNQLAGVPGPLVPLAPNIVSQLNVTSGTTAGGSQVTRASEEPRWPLPLQAPRWKDLREVINATLAAASTEARGSGITFETNKKLDDAIRQLDQETDDAVAELSPSDFVQARRFVRQLQDSRRTLADPNASMYLTGKWRAQGTNVGEVVQNMLGQGLRFAPALPGEEAAYRVMHTSMVAYVGSQAQLTTQAPPRMPANPYQP